jgi:hypothetical protein
MNFFQFAISLPEQKPGKGAANYTLTADSFNSSFGTPVIMCRFTLTQWEPKRITSLGSIMQPGTASLTVKGDLQLAGNINWHGIIIATGIITSSGGGSDVRNIQDQILFWGTPPLATAISGSITVEYNSCDVKKSPTNESRQLEAKLLIAGRGFLAFP